MTDRKKIFITTGGGVGDLIMFTPALRRIKELHPNYELTILTKQQTVDVINRIPWIDHVIGVRRGIFLSRFRALEDLYGQDVAVFTDWQPHLLPFAYIFGISERIGKSRLSNPISRLLTQTLTHDVMRETRYAAETNALLFAEALHIEIPGDMTHPDVSMPTDEEKQAIYDRCKQFGVDLHHPFILLTPYSSRYERDWPVDYIYEFIELVKAKYNMPVIVAGITKENNDRLQDVPYNVINRTSFAELVALIGYSTCHISVDSGPMHVSAALGQTVIPLFNKDLPSRWAPKHHCYPIYLGDDSYKVYGEPMPLVNQEDWSDIRNITPYMVYNVLEYLENRNSV
ncbi:hypothetical protein VEHSUH05_04840 [Veillonella denticariosi JCM 15641]|uniref:Glycosyltransferase family 9 protein n=1 Tax=Veillonella denticariosi JCM 15641 TaxID=1298594 RepID=A0A2S7ZB02_9FIRM|nr:glycosyltransferase family 9 protein [Veillonella denticariosi]PQL20395.1 hypothetical protein VEHSUH05_04840 [Veillonella denticariosi JCM 15641]